MNPENDEWKANRMYNLSVAKDTAKEWAQNQVQFNPIYVCEIYVNSKHC